MVRESVEVPCGHLLVLGEQRSGTTLLARLLDAQPEIRVSVGLLEGVLRATRDMGLTVDAPLTERQHNVVCRELERMLRVMGHAAPAPRRFESTRAAIEAALRVTAEPGTMIVGAKGHGPHESALELVNDGAWRVLCIFRDVRDVALSRWFRGEELIDQYIWRWKRAVRLFWSTDHSRIECIRYEDLVADPSGTLGEVSALLGLELESDPRVLRERLADTRFDSSFRAELVPLDSSPAHRWKHHRSEPWVRYAATVCMRELATMGYENDLGVGRRERAAYWRRWARVVALRQLGSWRERARAMMLPPLSQ